MSLRTVVCLLLAIAAVIGAVSIDPHRPGQLLRPKRTHFDWQPADNHSTTSTTTTTTSTSTRSPETTTASQETTTVTGSSERPEDEQPATEVADAGLILWGHKAQPTTTASDTQTTNVASNIQRIMEAAMPTVSEDTIRVLKLSANENYGHGHAKPKYISMALATMKSTEFEGDATTTAKQLTETTTTATDKPHTEHVKPIVEAHDDDTPMDIVFQTHSFAVGSTTPATSSSSSSSTTTSSSTSTSTTTEHSTTTESKNQPTTTETQRLLIDLLKVPATHPTDGEHSLHLQIPVHIVTDDQEQKHLAISHVTSA